MSSLKLLILLSAELTGEGKKIPKRKRKYSLVGSDVVRRGLWKAKHPANNPAAVQAPAQVAHLSPPPSMLHFHHPLREQGLPLGGHEDGPKADLFDPHLAVTLEEGGRKSTVTHCDPNRRVEERASVTWWWWGRWNLGASCGCLFPW